ncbi:MAG TPA: hypothetical protein VFJ02_08670 [Vicinamibacterales bacterium]|nr:hypothetical protein [Vicinamibacterales bacterium]
MFTFLTVLTVGMVTTLVVVMTRAEQPRAMVPVRSRDARTRSAR